MKVPQKRNHDLETEFLHHLEEKYASTLETIRQGNLSDEVTDTLTQVAAEISRKYQD